MNENMAYDERSVQNSSLDGSFHPKKENKEAARLANKPAGTIAAAEPEAPQARFDFEAFAATLLNDISNFTKTSFFRFMNEVQWRINAAFVGADYFLGDGGISPLGWRALTAAVVGIILSHRG